MIIKIFVNYFFGGLFGLKKKINNSKFIVFKKFLLVLYSIYQSSEGSYIGINANIKNALLLPHGLKGIFISGEAKIGENCVIFQQVTIGSNSLPFSKSIGAPIIGNDCLIGAGAKIIGGVKIGDNCRIGANCVVTEDMPNNSIAFLKCSIIEKKSNVLINRHYFKENNKWAYYKNEKLIYESVAEILNELNTNFPNIYGVPNQES